MNWDKLYARTVRGKPDSPLIIALHGFGQTVKPVPWWRQWFAIDYLDFETMSGLVEECELRQWSLYMPQAPYRNWKPQHAAEAGKMFDAAKKATGNNTRPHVIGFSDGATLVNRLLFGGIRASSYVSYEGMFPPITCAPRKSSRSLFVCGESDGSKVRDRIVQHSDWTTDRMMAFAEDCPEMRVDFLRVPISHHEWLRCLTSTILDWVG